MGAGILMFDTDVGVFRNGHVLREHAFRLCTARCDSIDVADTVSRREPDWVARSVFLKCYRRRYSEHDGSWTDC